MITVNVKPDEGYALERLAAVDKNDKEHKLTDEGGKGGEAPPVAEKARHCEGCKKSPAFVRLSFSLSAG